MTTTETIPPVRRHVSYSALSTFLHCPKQTQLGRVLGLKEKPSCWSAGGNAAHRASESHDRDYFVRTGR